jgi:hypothetical protein
MLANTNANFTKLEIVLGVVWFISFCGFCLLLSVIHEHPEYSIISGLISTVCYMGFLSSLVIHR